MLFIKTSLILLSASVCLAVGPISQKKHNKTPPGPTAPPSGDIASDSSEEDDEEGLRPLPDARRARVQAPLRGLTNDPCSAKHPIETYTQIASSSRAQASPDGGLYFLSDLREITQVYYLKSAGMWPKQITFFPDGAAYYELSPDGQKLLVASQSGGNEQYGLYLVEPKKQTVTPLLVDPKVRIESVQWNSNSSGFAFTSNQRNGIDFDLYRYSLATRTPELVAELSGFNSISDISPDDAHIAVNNYRSVTDSDVSLWNTATKTSSLLSARIGAGAHGDLKFTGDSKNFFFVSDMHKGMPQVFLLPLVGGQPQALTQSNWGVEEFALDHGRTTMVVGFNEGGYTRFEGFDVDRVGKRRRLILLPPLEQTIASSINVTRHQGRTRVFYTKSSSTQIPDIWLWTHPKEERWTRSPEGLIKSECFVAPEIVQYPSFDKTMIPALLYKPRGMAGAVPFIVSVHGGPEGQSRPSFSKTLQYFLERGYGVFVPNVRGSTGYGRDFTLMDNYLKRMDSVQDLIEGTKWLITNNHAEKNRIGVIGGSYGGFMVLRSIQVEPTLFAAAAESVGISNFVTFLKNTAPYRRALREVEYGPLTDEAFLKSISPMTYLDQIKTPLLIFHGANDPRVPVSETEQLVAALKRKSVPVEAKIFTDEGHGNKKMANIMEQAKLTAYFFEKHLGKK